jgi:hypothetical protein
MFSAALLLLSFSLLAASQIRADGMDSYVYEFGGNTFTWELPTNPVIAPDNAYLGMGFTIPDLSFSENGVAMVGTLDFYNTSMDGGFDLWIGGYYFSNAYGPQLYTGPESAPTLLTGTFSLTDYGNGDSPTEGNILQVTSVSSVPEPSTFSLLAIGLAIGLVFTFLRKN